MDKLTDIPILEGAALHKIHFGHRRSDFPFEETPFYINRLEQNREKINFPLPPHRKIVNDFLFITRGESVRSKGLNNYRFGKNQFFFMPAFEITTHESMSEDIEGFFVHFSPQLFADFPGILKKYNFLKLHTNPLVTVAESTLTPVLNILERLLDIYQSKKLNPDFEKLTWYLKSLFSEIDEFVDKEHTERKNTSAFLTQQYKDALTQQIYDYRTVTEFSDFLNVTPNHLNKCVKSTLNKTAQSLLNEMLLLEAKSLLKYSNLTLMDIAHKLFKSTPSNFSRFFKNQTGVSPHDFRHLK